MQNFSGTTPSAVNIWKDIGSIGPGKEILMMSGAFYRKNGEQNTIPGGVSGSEKIALYYNNTTGYVNVLANYNYALNNPLRVTVLYLSD